MTVLDVKPDDGKPMSTPAKMVNSPEPIDSTCSAPIGGWYTNYKKTEHTKISHSKTTF